jgi:hypothetical protein
VIEDVVNGSVVLMVKVLFLGLAFMFEELFLWPAILPVGGLLGLGLKSVVYVAETGLFVKYALS